MVLLAGIYCSEEYRIDKLQSVALIESMRKVSRQKVWGQKRDHLRTSARAGELWEVLHERTSRKEANDHYGRAK